MREKLLGTNKNNTRVFRLLQKQFQKTVSYPLARTGVTVLNEDTFVLEIVWVKLEPRDYAVKFTYHFICLFVYLLEN